MVKWLQSSNLRARLTDAGWICFLLSALLSLTAWCVLDTTGRMGQVLLFFEYAACALFFLVIVCNFICKEYPWKVIVLYGLFALVIALSAYFSKDKSLVVYFLLLGAAYKQNSRRLLFLGALLTGAVLLLTVLCSQIGLAPNTFWYRDYSHLENVREGLGFVYTSTGASLYFAFLLQYFCLRKEKLRLSEAALLAAVHVFFFIKTDSRMPFYFGLLVLAFFTVMGLWKQAGRFFSKIQAVFAFLPSLVAVLALFGYYLYDRVSPFWVTLNNWLSGRLMYGKNAIKMYGVSLFGKPITWIGHGSGAESGEYNYVDCAYLQVLLQFGILVLIAFLAVYTVAVVKAGKHQNFPLVFAMFFASLYNVIEPNLISALFAPLFITAVAARDDRPMT